MFLETQIVACSLKKNTSALENKKKLFKKASKMSNKAHNCLKIRVKGK